LCRHICQNLAEIRFYHVDISSSREVTCSLFKICSLYTTWLMVDHIRANMVLAQETSKCYTSYLNHFQLEPLKVRYTRCICNEICSYIM
jgi:hypothetical protein